MRIFLPYIIFGLLAPISKFFQKQPFFDHAKITKIGHFRENHEIGERYTKMLYGKKMHLCELYNVISAVFLQSQYFSTHGQSTVFPPIWPKNRILAISQKIWILGKNVSRQLCKAHIGASFCHTTFSSSSRRFRDFPQNSVFLPHIYTKNMLFLQISRNWCKLAQNVVWQKDAPLWALQSCLLTFLPKIHIFRDSLKTRFLHCLWLQ